MIVLSIPRDALVILIPDFCIGLEASEWDINTRSL